MPKTRLAGLFLAALSVATLPLAAQELPRKAGEWAIYTPDGKQILLSSYRGKVVVLAFILTTCPHCQKTVGILTKLQPEYAARGLQVLASAVEENPRKTVPGFVRNFQPSFPVGFNEDANQVLDFWHYSRARLPLMPVVLIVDRQGVIRFEHEGHDENFYGDQQEQNFRREIEQLLKSPATSSAKKTAKKG